jgi:SAM-dependent methyltransferase
VAHHVGVIDVANVSDSWSQGDAYERYIGRWSRRVAPRFLEWLAIPPGRSWLDVGCGTGVLCEAILDRCEPSSVDGVEPSEGFRQAATLNLGRRVRLHRGDAASIQLADDSVEVVVSGLVLNFIPDLPAALAEMSRVAAPGATVGAYVWDYAEGMQYLRIFWAAASELDSAAVAAHEGIRFPLCQPDRLTEEFTSAGFVNVQAEGLTVSTVFANFADYWEPFLGGTGPAPAYVTSLSEGHREQLRSSLHESLPTGADGTIPLTARVWAVRGTVSL